ncbi:hypothetical protein YC2023_086508 [Brassica napus]
MGYNCVSLILTILLVVITWPVVYGNDATPIPQNKNRIEQWFNTNVPSLASRKDKLDPALLTAEATPRCLVHSWGVHIGGHVTNSCDVVLTPVPE